MSNDAIMNQLTDVMRDVFDDDELTPTAAMTADDVDGWDSFAHLRLIAAVEKRFGVDFAASEITALQNVGELAALITSKKPT